MDIRKPEEKFWKLSSLVERLLFYLDPSSTLHLAQAQVMDKDIFRESLSMKAWENLVKQSTFGGENRLRELEEQRESVKTFVEILKLLQPKMPEEEEGDGEVHNEDSLESASNIADAPASLTSYMLPLLHRMCEKFPSFHGYDTNNYDVLMNCPCQDQSHRISFKGFRLLEEEVEGPFGTTIQSLVSLDLGFMTSGLLALSSRMTRQDNVVNLVKVESPFTVEDDADVQACITLLQAQQVSISLRLHGSANNEDKEIGVDKNDKGDKGGSEGSEYSDDSNYSLYNEELGDKGRWEVTHEGWRALASAMQVKPNGVQGVEASKDWLAELSREDTKVIWEALGDTFTVHESEDASTWEWGNRWDLAQCMVVAKSEEDTWAELEEILDRPEDKLFDETADI